MGKNEAGKKPRTGRKPKTNRKANAGVSAEMDRCYTPPYALDPLLPYLDPNLVVWEPAAGDGRLAATMRLCGFHVMESEIQRDPKQNFFHYQPAVCWDIQITNPPYSIKDQWIKRSYGLGRPFALLMPLETLGGEKYNSWFERYGMELIIVNPRINFYMPNAGYTGGGAQFPTAWFTWGLEIGRDITYAKINLCADAAWVPPQVRMTQAVLDV